jgi:branched-subunit amino acid ABC-type transport system permease component
MDEDWAENAVVFVVKNMALVAGVFVLSQRPLQHTRIGALIRARVDDVEMLEASGINRSSQSQHLALACRPPASCKSPSLV